ncbi:hypothetical protein TNCV_4337701 [Trichonephila clavipes]|uniref:Uncharacterized protein n=1 Tax=Trichonephila clavipes TaxID=2585209 RepID=A0A8X6SN44_TRICX|nr:hypothetical protein TNCV_4337701 [Trichonephila clavipes]
MLQRSRHGSTGDVLFTDEYFREQKSPFQCGRDHGDQSMNQQEPEGECNEWQKDDTRAPSSGRMNTYRVSLPPRWRADVPMSARAKPLEFVLY